VFDHDLAAPERWLDSQRRSRGRRFAAARATARRRFGRRSAVTLMAVMALGAGAAAADQQTARVQQQLGIPADGVAGPQTKRAVKAFQRAHGLVVDGIIGPQTLAALGISAARAATSSGAGRASAPSSTLAAIAACESGGDPTAVSSDGLYRGKYQFSRSTWRAMGGTGDPAAAPESVQDRLAAKLYATQGSTPWPNCA
jgi:Transglycosylase-like domain/Putative peptidoglycan binding domain